MLTTYPKIKKGQVYWSKISGLSVEVVSAKNGKWLTRILTKKPGVYKGSHTFTERSIRKSWVLIS